MGRFLDPLKILSKPKRFFDDVARAVQKSLRSLNERRIARGDRPVDVNGQTVLDVVAPLFSHIYDIPDDDVLVRKYADAEGRLAPEFLLALTQRVSATSERLAEDGHWRAAFTSSLIKSCITSINTDDVEINEHYPALSIVELDCHVRLQIECLKHIVFEGIIRSPRVRQSRFMGREVVRRIFDVLTDDEHEGWIYLPEDYRALLRDVNDIRLRRRIVCDYIAGMTDRFALTFYQRLASAGASESIFGPT